MRNCAQTLVSLSQQVLASFFVSGNGAEGPPLLPPFFTNICGVPANPHKHEAALFPRFGCSQSCFLVQYVNTTEVHRKGNPPFCSLDCPETKNCFYCDWCIFVGVRLSYKRRRLRHCESSSGKRSKGCLT